MSHSSFYVLFLRVIPLYSPRPYIILFVFFLMIRRPPRSTLDRSSAASDVYKRQITVSDYMRHEVQSFFDVNPDKIRVIPNGVNTAAFDEQRERDNTVERQLYAQPDEQIVFHIGRLVHEKGASVLIEAIPFVPVSYTHLRAHETVLDLVCRLLLEKKQRHGQSHTRQLP